MDKELPKHIRDDFVRAEDGLYYYWPIGASGMYTASHLRWIANQLDNMNTEWETQIHDYFNQQAEAFPEPIGYP